MEQNNHNDQLVSHIEEARNYDEYVDACYEPDSDPDLSVIEAPYSEDEGEVQVEVEGDAAAEAAKLHSIVQDVEKNIQWKWMQLPRKQSWMLKPTCLKRQRRNTIAVKDIEM
mmetsp:Transcript_95872/g.165247  ORF Transcript_95872/g.165247 Transcript_95872/m.165247 type:complete len:112 (-) Transcript_95872:305-640(-)